MATPNYNLPTITTTDTADGVAAINGLANATDSALKEVADAAGSDYTLPVATSEALGGVKAGKQGTGLTLSADGTIAMQMPITGTGAGLTVDADGTIAMQMPITGTGGGLTVDADGTISLDTSAIAPIVAEAVKANFTTGTTWGELSEHGFVYPVAEEV